MSVAIICLLEIICYFILSELNVHISQLQLMTLSKRGAICEAFLSPQIGIFQLFFTCSTLHFSTNEIFNYMYQVKYHVAQILDADK